MTKFCDISEANRLRDLSTIYKNIIIAAMQIMIEIRRDQQSEAYRSFYSIPQSV